MNDFIKFTKESDTSWSAISTNVDYNGWHYEELYWCDIDKVQGGFIVRWNDNYKEPHKFREVLDAQQYIALEYYKHKPFENGPKYEIE